MSACEDPQATHPPWSLENYPPGKNFLDQNRTERGKEREEEGEREGGEVVGRAGRGRCVSVIGVSVSVAITAGRERGAPGA